MADMTEVYDALRKADAAGDKEGAAKLAAYIQSNSSQQGTNEVDKTSNEYISKKYGQSALINLPESKEDRQKWLDWRESTDKNIEDKNKREKDETLLQKVGGAFDAGLTMASGSLMSVPAVATALAKKIGNRDVDVNKEYESVMSKSYKPRTETGQRYLENTAEAAKALQPIAPHEMILMQAAARPALSLAGDIAKQEVGVAKDAVKSGASNVASAMVPKMDPEKLKIAQKAQAMGIPLRPDQLYDNKFAKLIGETLEQVPLSGAKTEDRQIAFNRALIRSIGGDDRSPKLTQDVYVHALNKSGQGIGDIAKKYDIKVNDNHVAQLKESVANTEYMTPDVAKVINNRISQINSKIKDGEINGETFRRLNTAVNRQATTTSNGDLKHALGELQEVMHDMLSDSITKESDKGALRQFRRQYANAKTIEPIVAKTTTGDFPATQLMGAVTSSKDAKTRMAKNMGGELGELAKVGQVFMKDQPTSNTPERLAAYGLLSGGAFTNPAATAGVVGGANVYNRAAPSIANAIINKQIQMQRGSVAGVPGVQQSLEKLMSK